MGGTRPVVIAVCLVAGVGGLALLLAHCARDGARDAREAEVEEGGRLYLAYCALCHGEEGEGYAADDANALANQDFLVSVTDEFLYENIAQGHPGTAMAAYGRDHNGPLDRGEMQRIVAYIRSWQREPEVTLPEVERGDKAQAAVVFARQCASCHGSEGEGATAISLNNAVFLDTASDGQIAYAILHGRRGTPMPAFEDELTDQQLSDLLDLIRSWQTEVEAARPATPVLPQNVVTNPDGEKADLGELRVGRYVPSAVVNEQLRQGRRMVILDARPPSDYVRYHLPGAVDSPYYEVETVMERLPRDGTPIVAYCGCPHAASGRVMDFLRENDFENTAVLDEGVRHWHDEGYPVVEGAEPGDYASAAED